jgi:hypothetical protein
MDSFSESLQYITTNVDSQFELRLQEFDNTYNENISWLENVSKECKTAFESTIERIFLAEKKTKAKQTRELFTPLKEFNYSAPDRVALSRQLATPASAYRPRTRAAVKQLQEEVVVANKENQMPVENKIVEQKVVEVKKPVETKKAAPKGKSKVQAAVEKMEEKIIEEKFGKKKVEEKPVEQPKKEEVVEESEEEKKEDDEASEKEDDKPQGRSGRLKATRTTAAAKKAAAAAKRAATIAEKKARAAREAEEREKAEREEQERQAKLEEEKAERERVAAAEAKEKKRLAKEEKDRKAKLEKEKAEQEEKERLEREQAEREEKEREAKAKKAAEEADNESEEEAPAPKKKGRTKKTYVKKTTARGRKRARAAESEDESEAQSASEEVPKPKTKKAKLSNEKSDAEHVLEDVKMDEVKPVEKEEIKKDEEDEFIVDVVGTATPAKRVALPTPAIDDAIMADLPLEFEENIEIITTKTPSKPKVAPRISIDSQDEVDVVIKPKTADFIVHEESEISSTVVASVVEPLNAEVTPVESVQDSAMQVDSDADSQSEASQGPSTLTESGDDISGKAEKKQKKVGFAASQAKPALASSNSSKALDINDKLKRAADNRQMLEQKKREEMEKKRAQAASKVEALKKSREDSVKKPETASSNAAKKMEVEETKEDDTKKAEATQDASKEEDAQSRRKRFLIQSLEEKKHNSASREGVDTTAPKPQGPAPAPQGPKLSLLAFLKKPALLTDESASTTQNTSATSDPEESESSGSEKEVSSSVDLKSAANVIPKPSGASKPPSSFSDLRKFIRDGSDEHAAPAPKPAIVAPTPVITAPTPVVESKPLPSASNFGFKPISRENSANNISAPSSIKSTTSAASSGPSSLAPPSLSSVQSHMRDAQMMPPPQSPSSIRATSVKSFIPIKLAQSPKASPHSPQQVLSPKLSASMLYSPSPPRSPLRPRGFLDSPECQCPILDYCSDDDSDSEIDLPVPAWTQKENLYKALEMQTTVDPDEIFGKELGKNIDLNAIFGTNPRRPAYKK